MKLYSLATMASVFALARLTGLASIPGAAPAEGYGLFELGIPHGAERSGAVAPAYGALGQKAAIKPFEYSYAYLVSHDGSVVIGTLDTRLYRWESGVLEEVSRSAWAKALTPDGTVMVGVDRTAFSGSYGHAYRWTGSVGLDLGTLGGRRSHANAVSDNGAVVVGAAGFSMNHDHQHAFRWENGVMTDIDFMGGNNSEAMAVSADGAVVVGVARMIPNYHHRAFRWENGTGIDLGSLGGEYVEALAVSADGSVIAGDSSIDKKNNHFRVFRWSDGVMSSLGTLGGNSSLFKAMTPDGTVIVGFAQRSDGDHHAFRWSAEDGMQDLGTLGGGTYSAPRAVTPDGKVVVGYSMVRIGGDDISGFRWEQETGMLSVEDWLRSTGVAVSDSLKTAHAFEVSADGMVVVGTLRNGHAYIARSAQGLITIADLQESLAGGADALNMGRAAGELVMNGAHGHPLDRRTAPGRFTAWVGGDIGADDHGDRDGSLGVGEIGVGYNFGPAQINLAVGFTKGNQDTFLGGRTDFDGTYVIADVIAAVPQTPLVATFTAFYQNGELRSTRGYLNAGLVDYAKGVTDVATYGGAARLDWENAFTTSGFKFTPYTKLSLTHTRVDGFAESGGFFPATYDARNDTLTELTIGVNTSRVLTSRLTLKTTLAGVHRFQDQGSSIGGEVAGVSAFNLPGEEYRQTWLYGSLGVDYAVSNGVFSISVNTTTRGGASNLWLAASHQIHF